MRICTASLIPSRTVLFSVDDCCLFPVDCVIGLNRMVGECWLAIFHQTGCALTSGKSSFGHRQRTRPSYQVDQGSCTYPQGRSSSYESRRGRLSVEPRLRPLSWCDSWSSHQDSEELCTSFFLMNISWWDRNVNIRYKCLVVFDEFQLYRDTNQMKLFREISQIIIIKNDKSDAL